MKLSIFARNLDEILLGFCDDNSIDEAHDVLGEGDVYAVLTQDAIKIAKNAVFCLNYFLRFSSDTDGAKTDAEFVVCDAAREYDASGDGTTMEKDALAFVRAVRHAVRRVLDGEKVPSVRPNHGEKFALQGEILTALKRYLSSVASRADFVGGDEWRDVVNGAIKSAID